MPVIHLKVFSLFLVMIASLVIAQPLELSGSINGVHDPVLIEENGRYYLFSTGPGVPIRCSDDMLTWKLCRAVFFGLPDWIKKEVPAVGDLWAPDISYYNGKYQVFYSASTFGQNTSAIGLATNITLDFESPDYAWKDEGLVIKSKPGNSTPGSDNSTLDKINLN